MKKERLIWLIAFCLILGFCIPLGATETIFNDVQNHWAEKQVYDWVNKGLISGYPDATFKPDHEITRVEFIALTNRAFGYQEMAELNFPDVKKEDWFATEIAKAKAVGYIGGYSDGTVKPNNFITRQEVAAVLVKILNPESSPYILFSKFTDSNEIPEWSMSAINTVVANNYMGGYPDGTFKPTQLITRAESLSVLDRAIGALFNQPGIYTTDLIEGNLTISHQDITLKNTIINGNLYLTEGIGQGTVVLDNVQVKGTTRISGGGENSILIKDSILGTVLIDSSLQQKIRVLAQGSTKISSIEVKTNVKLQEQNLTDSGFEKVLVQGAQIELLGDFSEVKIEERAQIDLLQGAIQELLLAPATQGTTINLAPQTTVDTFITYSAATVTGDGVIQTADIKANGVALAKDPISIIIAEGVTASIAGKETTGDEPASPPDIGDIREGGSSKTKVSDISVEGVAKIGETLTAKVTPSGATVSYKWQRSASEDKISEYSDIPGATAETYVLTEDDLDRWIKVEVTGTGSYTGTKTSNAVGIVGAEASPATVSAISVVDEDGNEIVGEVVVGETLTAKVTPEKATVTYKWMRADAEDGEYVAIAGATDKTYIDLEAFNALDSETGQTGGRQTAVMKDLVSNKPSSGYDQDTLKAVFDSIVAVRTATQASMDLVNEAESLENIAYVEDLLNAFKGVADGHTIHSGKAISDKVTELEDLVADFEALPEANQEAALQAVITNRPEGGYLRSQSTLDALANAIAEQEGIIEGAIDEALAAVNAITGTAADIEVIKDNAKILGLDLEAFNALDSETGQTGGRQTAVMKDLVSNKPSSGYDQDTLKAVFDSIVAVRTATQASMDLVNEAESLENIAYVEDLLNAFKGVADGHTIHSGKAISDKVTELEDLVADFEALPEANQEAALQAVITNRPEGGYLRSQSTLDALANAIAEQEGIIEGAIDEALAAVNAITGTAADIEVIKDNAKILGLDLEAFNALDSETGQTGGRQTAVMKDLVSNKPSSGYDQDTLKAVFDSIVAVRTATQASMDLVNEAESLENIAYVEDLLNAFKGVADGHTIHSGKAISDKVTELEDLVADFEALPEANQEAALQAVITNRPEGGYLRSQSTLDALANAIAEQEGIIEGAIDEALAAVNAITGTAADIEVIKDNAKILGLDLEAFNALDSETGQTGGRQTAVMKDLVSNKPSSGYDQDTLKAVFDSIVAVRTATQASMDLVNEAESLENIAYVEDLLNAFKGVADGHTIHSGKAISDKVTELEDLVADFEALPEANQEAALQAVITNRPEGGYLRSQSTLDALANAIAEQEGIIEGAIDEALAAVNAITGTAADIEVIKDNAKILGLDLEAFNALDSETGQTGGRQTAVMKDLVSNKPSSGYDQDTLKAVFDSIVAVRTATQASMDLVNEAESLENIAYVEDLLNAFKGVADGHTIHSGKAISDKVTELEDLVADFEALPEANQEAALQAVITNRPEGGYLRSQSTLDALANAIAEQEGIIEGAIDEALAAVNAITGTAADIEVIKDNAKILGLDLEAFNALDSETGQTGGRQTAVMKDLVSNKPSSGYDQDTLKAVFDSIVAVRTATQASMDLVNEAESLENIAYVEDLLNAFKGVADGHTIHSGKAISDKVTELEDLVADFEALPEANQEAALQAVITNRPEGGYLRSQSTLDALANAIAEQEGIIEGAIDEALAAVNAITGTAADIEVIKDNAKILGLDLEAFNALDSETGQTGGRQTAVMKDLVSNKPSSGYDQDTLKAVFDSIVAVRTATQASMDLVNEAESLENIAYVEDLLNAFKGVADGHTIHSGKAISDKVTELEDLVADFEALPEANQEAALQAVITNRPEGGYLRSQSTLDALANAIAEQEGIIEGAIDEALAAVNAITGTAADIEVIKDNAKILGLDLEAFNALDSETGQTGGRQTAVMKDLVSNKPSSGYDQDTLKAVFDSIVAVRTATQASMDLVNEAESLENIAYVEDLLNAFKGVADGHTIHSGKAISDKVTELEDLVADFEALPEANQEAALQAVITNRPEGGYLRSQSTLDALANAIAEQEGIIEGAIDEALAAVNAITGTAADIEVIKDNAKILGLDLEAFNALDSETGQTGGRQTAVMKDLVSNKPSSGYDQDTLKAVFDSIVAVRTATQASMDLVNEAESLENIAYVEDLLNAFKGVADGHTIHSGKAISDKVTELEDLVADFEALPEANQEAALQAVITNRPEGGYLRSQSTLDALANAIAEQEGIIEGAIDEALAAVNAITGTAADIEVIKDNAKILGLDLEAFNALDSETGQTGGRQTAVMKDLVSNKPSSGYDQDTLKAVFDSIVAVRTATQASMDLVNEAESLENIAYVEDLLNAFKGVADGHTIHSGKAISDKVTELEDLVADFEALPEANQEAALQAVITNRPEGGYLRSQSTLDALANAIAEQEGIIEGAIDEALAAVNAITGTAADIEVIKDNAKILGLDLEAFNALDSETGQTGGRQTAVMKDLVSNKPSSGYDQDTLKAVFDSIVAVRTATQASMDLVNEAESLENIAYVEDLLNAFKGVADGHTIHSGKAISDKVTELEDLVADFEALPEANQEAALQAVITNRPEGGYLRSQSTLDALANAIAEQEGIIEGAIDEALAAVNAITGTAADIEVIKDNAKILGLDLEAFNALDSETGQTGGRQTAVMKDLVSNKPSSGYDQDTLKAVFDSIVAVRTATQASMDLVNEAESLENIAYVEDLLNAFKGVADGHTIHSGKAISDKVTELEDLVADFEALPEANQEAALQAVITNRPEGGYLRSQSTLDALANAIAEQEGIIEGAIDEALAAVNAITGTAADIEVIKDNAKILGLDLEAFNALDSETGQTGGRQTAVMKDLVSNKPSSGYDQDTLKAVFDSIVAVRTATQASMDLVNEAESLENIAYVEDLLNAFKGVADGHTIHSGKAISDKVTELEDLVADFEALPEANQEAALQAVITNRPEGGYLRSQSTLDALANAIAEQEGIIEGAIDEALAAVNAITGTAADIEVIKDNAKILGLDLEAFNALDSETGQTGGRQTAVMKDLVSNKPSSGYDQDTLKAVFDSIVAVRTATQASMDLVNEAESLENIAYVEDLLNAFKGVADGHTIHSGKAISDKVTELEDLVADFEALPEANQEAALQAVITNRPEGGYLRSQSTLDALANAIAEQEGIIEGAIDEALAAVNAITGTAADIEVIKDNAKILGLDLEAFNALDSETGQTGGRQTAVMKDLVSNKPSSGYDQDTLKAVFDSIVAVRTATQASMDLVNEAESLENIAYVEDLLNAFKGVADGHTIHSGKAISDKVTELEDLVADFEALPEANQEAALQAVITNRPEGGYLRSQSTLDALANAIAEQEGIIEGAIDEALAAVNAITGTAADIEVIKDNAKILGLDLEAFNALDSETGQTGGRQTAVMKDLVSNKPSSGYDQDTLKAVFDSIVAVRTATQASMDLVNEAESLENIAYVEDLLNAFKGVADGHTIHSGKAISDKVTELEDLVADFEALPEANQEAALQAVITNRPEGGYLRSQSTLDALANAIAEQEGIIEGAIDEALAAVNAITGTAADIEVIKDNAKILGLDLEAFNALDSETGQTGGRQTAVMKDLVSNKPSSGYDQDTLKAVFDSIVAVRTATQASMDLVNEAESLENIAYVEDLLNAFKGVADGHTIHSGKAISDKVTELEDLVADFEALPEANQEAALQAVITNRPEGGYLRSQSTLDALANAIAEQEGIIEGAIDEALAAVNAITGTAADIEVIKDNAKILGLDLEAFNALDSETGQTGGRQTAVMKDLVSNKPSSGYDQDTLKAVFDSIVAVRTATQASMDLVNEAESLENIAYVEDLLNAFKGVADGHTIHSGKAISDKVTELEDLVADFEALPEANQEAALQAVITNRPEGGYLRSQSTLDALANAIAEQEGIVGDVNDD
jgi:prophage DNA circulation protein